LPVKALLRNRQHFSQQNGDIREAIEAVAESQGKLLDRKTERAAVKGKADAPSWKVASEFDALKEKLLGQDAEQ
jgi:hypothetical protein